MANGFIHIHTYFTYEHLANGCKWYLAIGVQYFQDFTEVENKEANALHKRFLLHQVLCMKNLGSLQEYITRALIVVLKVAK